MLASFIVRLVITDGGSIRHGLMQCSIAFSIARQGRRTQARGLGPGGGAIPPQILADQLTHGHGQRYPISIRIGSDIPPPPNFQIFLGPCHTFILMTRYQQSDPQIFILLFEFFYIILRVSEGKKCAILQSWNEFTCSTNLSYNQLGLFLSQTSRLVVRKIFPQGNSRYYGIFVTSPK